MKNQTREELINGVLKLRSDQAEQWSTAKDAIAEYLMLYGVKEIRATEVAVDLLDIELGDIIDREGTS